MSFDSTQPLTVGSDAQAACEAVERFGCELLPETKHWLKVAGGPKAAVLAAAVERAPVGTVLEVGDRKSVV